MKILWGHKDGGPESNVRCWGIEIKSLFSILVLCFGKGSREAYHSHAFNATSWLIKGRLKEELIDYSGDFLYDIYYKPSFKPIKTYRSTFHKVSGLENKNWVVNFRGPWYNNWNERNKNGFQTLTHGRVVLNEHRTAD